MPGSNVCDSQMCQLNGIYLSNYAYCFLTKATTEEHSQLYRYYVYTVVMIKRNTVEAASSQDQELQC